MWSEGGLLLWRDGERREEQDKYKKRMVVPLESHMTQLFLLQGVRAAGQSHPSLLLYPSFTPSLCSPLNTSMCWCSSPAHAFVCACVHFSRTWLWAVSGFTCDLLWTAWRQLSLTMSFFCCFSFRDYGSKRKSGKSPVFLLYPNFKKMSSSCCPPQLPHQPCSLTFYNLPVINDQSRSCNLSDVVAWSYHRPAARC